MSIVWVCVWKRYPKFDQKPNWIGPIPICFTAYQINPAPIESHKNHYTNVNFSFNLWKMTMLGLRYKSETTLWMSSILTQKYCGIDKFEKLKKPKKS